MEQVFRLHTGNDVPGPRKHLAPHRCNMTVRSCRDGFSFFHPRVADPRPEPRPDLAFLDRRVFLGWCSFMFMDRLWDL